MARVAQKLIVAVCLLLGSLRATAGTYTFVNNCGSGVATFYYTWERDSDGARLWGENSSTVTTSLSYTPPAGIHLVNIRATSTGCAPVGPCAGPFADGTFAYASLCAAPPTEFWLRTKLFNFTSLWHTNYIYREDTGELVGYWDVPPHTEAGISVVAGPFTNMFNWTLYKEAAEHQLPSAFFEHQPTNNFSTVSPSSGGYAPSPNAPTTTTPTIGPGTPNTTNWVFSGSGTNGDARDSTLREGFSGLRSILGEGQEKAHEDAKAIVDALRNTNQTPVTTAEMTSQGTAAGTTTRASMESAGSALNQTKSGGGGGLLALTFPGNNMFGGQTVNIGPKSDAMLSILATWTRTAFLWLAVFLFIRLCMTVCEHYLGASTAARQASSAGTTVLGTNVNTPAALGMAGLITVALAAIPAIMVGITSSMSVGGQSLGTIIGANLFSGVGGPAGVGLGWANEVLPLAETGTLAMMYLAFRFQVGAVYTVATTAVRFFVG